MLGRFSQSTKEEIAYHELIKKKWRDYNNKFEVKEKRRLNRQSAKERLRLKDYWSRPEVKERKNKRNARPENKAKKRAYDHARYRLKKIRKATTLTE